MWFKTKNGWKDTPVSQHVRPGVPWIDHPNPAVRSDIYSELLALGIFVHAPEVGKEVTIRYSFDTDIEKRKKIKELASQIGFNGVLTIREIHRENEYVLSIIIDGGG